LAGANPSEFKGDDRPVDSLSWTAAKNFCQSAGLRLPTEVEWEYAARAGSPEDRYGDPDQIGWHSGNSGGQTHSVAQKKPNAWGLYDMLGNVWEWTGEIDQTKPGTVYLRGACYANPAAMLNATQRFSRKPDEHFHYGVRCAGDILAP
jgi:formylglycine-generating enzyme required for sulfatase activity